MTAVCALGLLLAGCGSTVQATNGTAAGAGTLAVPSTSATASAAGVPAAAGSISSPGAAGPGSGIGAAPQRTTGGNGALTTTTTGTTGTLPAGTGPAGASHGPIRIGFMHPNNDAAASAGVNNNTSVTPERVMKALVASYNAGGGIAGRRIMPYYEELRSSSNNFEGDLAAACAAFTQDDHVAFVVNAVGLYSESFQTCLAHAEVPVFSDLAPDRQDARQFPLLITPDDLLADTRVTQVVQRLAASGWLTSRNRIGVVIEDCPVDNRVFADTLKPVLASAGLSLAATANPQCFQSISDLGTIAGQMGNAVLDFRSKRVDRVMFVSIGQEGTLSYEFMLAASQQNWYPGYAMSSMSYATTVAAQSGVSRQEIANSRGIGWVPPNDSSDPRQSPETSGAKDCMARLGKQGLHPTTAVDDYSSWLVCDEMALANATLRASNGNASPGAMSRGVRVAATGFVSALTVAGRVGTWDNGRIGPAAFRYFSWVASKGGFLYTSSARPF